MYEVKYKNIKIKLIKGNIAEQKTDAIVNAANKRLAPGGGVAGAIHRAAGYKLWEECKKIGGCETGEAVITKGYKLPAKWVIHTVGPIWRNRKEDPEMLKASYVNSLILAEKYKIKSISFPAISTGAFGYPIKEASEIALKSVFQMVDSLSSVKLIQFVLYDEETYKIFEEKLKELKNYKEKTDSF
ncbi:MAG: O-acetyl-ADP-ribose deacetylase [candidate division WOR-3 bacterium]